MTDSERKPTATVFFDGQAYPIKPGAYSGDKLRHVPSPPVSPDKDLWLDILGEQDRVISPAETIDVVDGMRFFTEIPAITIKIDRDSFEVYAKKLTGTELRAVPSPDVAADRDLWLDVPDKRDVKVQDEDVIALHDGIRFFTAPGRINPGMTEAEADR
jgi:hypothetical protein